MRAVRKEVCVEVTVWVRVRGEAKQAEVMAEEVKSGGGWRRRTGRSGEKGVWWYQWWLWCW